MSELESYSLLIILFCINLGVKLGLVSSLNLFGSRSHQLFQFVVVSVSAGLSFDMYHLLSRFIKEPLLVPEGKLVYNSWTLQSSN